MRALASLAAPPCSASPRCRPRRPRSRAGPSAAVAAGGPGGNVPRHLPGNGHDPAGRRGGGSGAGLRGALRRGRDLPGGAEPARHGGSDRPRPRRRPRAGAGRHVRPGGAGEPWRALCRPGAPPRPSAWRSAAPTGWRRNRDAERACASGARAAGWWRSSTPPAAPRAGVRRGAYALFITSDPASYVISFLSGESGASQALAEGQALAECRGQRPGRELPDRRLRLRHAGVIQPGRAGRQGCSRPASCYMMGRCSA
jgi:hypothetical protein